MVAQSRRPAAAPGSTLEVTIAHSSPGRLRLRASRADIESGLVERALSGCASQAGVLDARLNAAARCLVIHYDERSVSEAMLLERLARDDLAIKVGVPAKPQSHGVPVASWLARGARQADDRVLEASRGTTDLRTLFPLSLAALAVREILAGRTTAVPWYALAWYAFDSFIKLRNAPRDSSSTGG